MTKTNKTLTAKQRKQIIDATFEKAFDDSCGSTLTQKGFRKLAADIATDLGADDKTLDQLDAAILADGPDEWSFDAKR